MAGHVNPELADFGSFITQFPRAVAVLDKRLRYRWVSRSWCEMYRRDAAEVLGRNHLEVFPAVRERPDLKQRCLIDRVGATERDSIRGPDGATIALRREASPWVDADGNLAGIIMISETVTGAGSRPQLDGDPSETRHPDLDEHAAHEQERVRRAENDRSRLEALVDSLDTLVAYVDPDERFVWVNRAYGSHWGLPPAEIVGKRIADLLSPEAYAKARGRITSALRGEARAYELEVDWRGESYPLMTTYVPCKDDDGAVQGFFATTTDISRLKVAELAQRQALEKADAANKAKTRFLASMSHEIRTPLNAIMGFAELLAREGHLNPVQSEYVHTIVSSGELLLTIINDVLELSRVEAGMVELNPTEFDLHAMLNEVLRMFEARVVDRPIGLRLEAGADAHVSLRGDAAKIRQVLINLMSNALKFTERGTVTLRARTEPDRARPGHRCVRLEVEDTGCGIPADRLEYIFEEFSRVSYQPRQVEGTGLGLSLCRTFAQLMGGEVSVTSEVGSGSTFAFSLSLPEIEQAQPTALEDSLPDAVSLDPGPMSSRTRARYELLPESIRTQIARAAAAANVDQLSSEIAAVRALDEALAEILEAKVRRFDFQSILRLGEEPVDGD